VVEVDRLPGVEHDGPGRAGVARARADVRVQRGAEAVQAAVGPHGVQPRRLVGLARLERQLAAPAQVHAPHLARAEAEPGRARLIAEARATLSEHVGRLIVARPLGDAANAVA
jgi:hypothetical protein